MTRAFRMGGRRQALAERHLPRDFSVQAEGRFHGLCSCCGFYHRNPDMRNHCSKCGAEICTQAMELVGFNMVCPGCGGRIEQGERGRDGETP